jgi:outer membrane protein TolC
VRLTILLLSFAIAGTAGERTLSVRAAVQFAIEHNVELDVERVNVSTAQAGALIANGAFDRVVKFGINARKATVATSSVLEAPGGRLDERSFGQTLGLQQRLPWQGMRWETSFENNRSSTNNPYITLRPSYAPRLVTSLTMPLLRNRSTDAERTELRIRRKMVGASEAEAEIRLVSLVSRVVNAYWEWVAARQSLSYARRAHDTASATLASTRRLVSAGELSSAEIAGARADVARREERAAEAEGVVLQAENILKSLLGAAPEDDLWGERLIPGETTVSGFETDINAAIREALTRRPEIRLNGVRSGIQEVERQNAGNALKPQVDLTISVTSQGLSGRAMPASDPLLVGPSQVPPALVGGAGRAMRQVFGADYPAFQAGLTLEFPMRNRAALGRAAQAELAAQRLNLERHLLDRSIALEVRQAQAALSAARARVTSAGAAADFSSERLESELRLFAGGESTNLSVATRQNELAEAQQNLVSAQRSQSLAVYDLLRSRGALLREFGVHFQ